MQRALLASALVLSAGLAGCTLLQDGDGRNGDLVRIVTLSMDPEGMEDVNDATDVLAAIADVRFEYTHTGDDRDVADVTITYIDETGRERTRDLSEFTSAETISRGDKVTIGGALLTSPVRIDAGGDDLASRGGPSRDWLEAGGYPLPLAMSGGLAVWDVSGRTSLDAGFDRIEVVERGVGEDWSCEPSDDPDGGCSPNVTYDNYTDSMRLQDAAATAEADLDGTLTLDSVGSFQPALELGLEGVWDLAALFGMRVEHERTGMDAVAEAFDVGLELDATAQGAGSLRFTFDQPGNLESVGGEGDLDVEGDLVVWDDDHARSEDHAPFLLDDLDVHTPFEETPVYFGDNPAGFVAQALSDLWRMDLAPGDEFSFATGDRFGDHLPSIAVTLRVVAEEDKEVPAGTFRALRVETTSVLTIPVPEGSPETFALPTLTTWIHERSGLPVAIEQSMSYDYDQEDFAPIFAAAQEWDEGLSVTPPEELHIELEGRTLAELTKWKEGFHVAPMAAVLLPLATMAAPMGWFFFGFGVPFGGDGYEEEYASAPDVAFSRDDGQDRLTVVKVGAGSSAWDYSLRASSDMVFVRNREASAAGMAVGNDWTSLGHDGPDAFEAGDYLEFCSPGDALGETVVSIMHVPSNTLLYESTFSSIAVCPS